MLGVVRDNMTGRDHRVEDNCSGDSEGRMATQTFRIKGRAMECLALRVNRARMTEKARGGLGKDRENKRQGRMKWNKEGRS